MRFIVLIFFLVAASAICKAQSYDWKDPLDLGFFDFGDNKLIGYNILGLGLAELLAHPNAPSRSIHEVSFAFLNQYRKQPNHNMYMLDYRWGKVRYDFLTWGVGSRFYQLVGPISKTNGFGGYLWFKWRILKKEKWGLSYDNGVGPNYFFNAFPSEGTKFNFTTYYALSLDLYLLERWMSFQFTNVHLSNAGIKGQDRNPSFDAFGLRLVCRLNSN